MDSSIKVSVIIPVYQVETYLERAVDSVLAQTLPEKEIILVDDGSFDASPLICDRYAQEYPGLVRVIHKENEGLGLTRNAGVRAARGEYVAFLDSDDSVEPEMYEELYQKAKQEDFDIVMCDVKILYVDEGRTSVISTYTSENVDLADYIANGNNITYSVNKLYRREIWEKHQYEKMLFEDISLIPALITHYPHIGYVPKPFYHYYRRANTISTTSAGAMVDIIQAFRNFLNQSDPRYRDEVVYTTAKQIYWNMYQSRTLFQADFIGLLNEFQKDFLLNPYLQKDKKRKKLLDEIGRKTIPETFICVHFGREIPPSYLEEIQTDFPRGALLDIDETDPRARTLPHGVRRALEQGNTAYAEEYVALKTLYEEGGIVLAPQMRAGLNLKRLRLNRVFFGFDDEEELLAGCFGACRRHYVIQALLDSYEEDNLFNKAFLPLKDRIRDFLILHFQLRMNGRSQLLKNEVQVYLPSVLAYDMKNGENCCKKAEYPVPEGYELVSGKVLKLWSDRLLENWNLYKQERNRKTPDSKPSASPPPKAVPNQALIEREMEERIQEVVRNYETSTCWKLTKPIRALAKLFGKEGG